MSKGRSISFSSAFSSQNQGFCQSRAWRTGASRLPSRMTVSFLYRSIVRRTKKGSRRGTPSPRAKKGSGHRFEGLLEAAGVALLGLRQGLEPLGDLGQALLARSAGHARVHVGVLVRLARDRGLEVGRGRTDRQAGRRIAAHFEEFEMAVRMAGLAFRGRTEHGSDIVVAFDVGLLGEVEIPAVRLALARESSLQIVLGLGSLEVRHGFSPCL